jgi:hypothetical protein
MQCVSIWRHNCKTHACLQSRKGLISRYVSREIRKLPAAQSAQGSQGLVVPNIISPKAQSAKGNKRGLVEPENLLRILSEIPSNKDDQRSFLQTKFNSYAAEPSFIWADELLPKAKFRPVKVTRGIEFRGHTLNDVRLLKSTFDVFRQAKCYAFDCRKPGPLIGIFRLLKDILQFNWDIFRHSPLCSTEMNGLSVTIRLLSKGRKSEALRH